MNLLSWWMISNRIGCTTFRRAAQNSSGLLTLSTMCSSTLSLNKSTVILFTVLLTKFGILLRSRWANLAVYAFSSIPKDFKFSIYSSFKSLTTNEPGSITSCSNAKLAILSYARACLHFISMSWLLFSLSILMHLFQRDLLHFAW